MQRERYLLNVSLLTSTDVHILVYECGWFNRCGGATAAIADMFFICSVKELFQISSWHVWIRAGKTHH